MTSARRPTLAIMVKEPRAGRVKTRLGREIGMAAAAWWARRRIERLVRELSDPRWRLVLAVAPDTARTSRALPASARIAQGKGDLGDRMRRVFCSLPPGPALIIGADIPGITRAHIAQGFRLLGAHEAVIGPASDGGYWAIGFKRMRPLPHGLFTGVRWSGPHARADTLATLGRCKLGYLPELHDVDTAADLARLSR